MPPKEVARFWTLGIFGYISQRVHENWKNKDPHNENGPVVISMA